MVNTRLKMSPYLLQPMGDTSLCPCSLCYGLPARRCSHPRPHPRGSQLRKLKQTNDDYSYDGHNSIIVLVIIVLGIIGHNSDAVGSTYVQSILPILNSLLMGISYLPSQSAINGSFILCVYGVLPSLFGLDVEIRLVEMCQFPVLQPKIQVYKLQHSLVIILCHTTCVYVFKPV